MKIKLNGDYHNIAGEKNKNELKKLCKKEKKTFDNLSIVSLQESDKIKHFFGGIMLPMYTATTQS